MYEERRYTFDWKGFFIKLILLLLLVLVIFGIFKLFPVQKNTLYDQIFNDNLTSMKDAAKSYYTVDRLPKNVGEEETMNLQEMLDNKLLVEFVDKDGKYCDTFGSYVTVTKLKGDEYTMKVQLSCGDHIDYILETIGCYNVCKDNCCGNCEEEKITEYEFKRAVKSNKEVIGCKSGYKLSNGICYKTIKSDIIAATKEYYEKGTIVTDAKINSESSYRQYTNKLTDIKKEYIDKLTNVDKEYIDKITTKGTTSYSCPSGYTINSNNTSCSKSVASQSCSAATCTSYQCGTKVVGVSIQPVYCKSCSGGGCSTSYSTVYASVNVSTSPDTYSCPTGYTEEGTGSSLKCYKEVTTYSCPADYTEEGSGKDLKCFKNVNVYSCPANFIEEGKDENLKCYKVIEGTNNEYCSDFGAVLKDHKCYKESEGGFKGYTCPKNYILDGDKCYKKSTTKTNTIMINKTVTTYEYKWSTETALEGWTRTGNTRLVSKDIAAEEKVETDKATEIVKDIREESDKEVTDRVSNITANENTNKLDTKTIIIVILIALGFIYLFGMFISTRKVTREIR